jgi:hypothetical protein
MMRFDTELPGIYRIVSRNGRGYSNPMVQTSRRIKYEKPVLGFCGFNRGTLYFETIIIGSQ